MRIQDRTGEAIPETTITVDDEELIDLLQGLADLVEGKKEHLHFAQLGGEQLVVRRGEAEDRPIERQMDWWVGPLILLGAVFLVVGVITVLRWALGLVA